MPSSMPVRYRPDLETAIPDEAEYDRKLTDAMLGISRTVWQDTGHVRRSVHAKSHGVLRGTVEVLPATPAEYAQGMFAVPARYPAILRLSTTPGDVLDDAVSTPRGLAVKFVGVSGERLPDRRRTTRRTSCSATRRPSTPGTRRKFLGNVHRLGTFTDQVATLKKAISAASRGVERALEAVGGRSTVLTTYAGQQLTHILGDTFYSQAPLRHGDYVAKLCVAPISPNLLALHDAPIDLGGRPDGLRELVREAFRQGGATWEVRIQLCTDLERMPIENASAKWPEDLSPYVAVARIAVPAQDSWADAEVGFVDEGLTFPPWRGLRAHQPLGSIMRARRRAYESSAAYRRERTGLPLSEPSAADPLPGR